MPKVERRSISMSLALANLTDHAELVKEAELELTKQRAIRDELIKDAIDAGLTYRTLQKATGLSRDRLFNIGRAGSND